MEENNQSVFNTLNSVDVNGHTELKNGLTYLSWAWAWAEVCKRYPDAQYTIYENKDGLIYHTDGKTAWVKTGVTINGKEHIEYLPVMDYKNNSIKLEHITSFDVNKAIQRSLTKACARHGLGLYIYAGEDLPEEATAPKPAPKKAQPKEDIIQPAPTTAPTTTPATTEADKILIAEIEQKAKDHKLTRDDMGNYFRALTKEGKWNDEYQREFSRITSLYNL